MILNMKGVFIMYKLNIKLLDPKAKLPEYAHKGDAGLDLFSIDDTEILQGECKLIHTGISIELQEGTEALPAE